MFRSFIIAMCLNWALLTIAAADCLDVGGSRIYFESVGAGPPIIFMHDGLLHSEVWDGQVTAFSAQYTFIKYDRRGYGRSDPPTEPFSNEIDLLRLFDANGIDRAVLVGSSSGGGIAVNFALSHPDRVIALVLVGAVVEGLGFSSHFTQRNAANFGADSVGRVDRWVADPWLVAPQNASAKARLRELLEADAGDLALEECKPSRAYPDVKPGPELALSRLHEIDVPTLIVTGAADIPDVHAHAGALVSGIKRAQRTVIADVGHLSYLENPSAFNELVLEFLSSIEK